MNKSSLIVVLAIVATLGSTLNVMAIYAESIPKQTVPEFTLRYVENPYYVLPTTKIDPYTGKNVTTQVGYHAENKSIEAIMQNNIGASFYNFRYKGHYEENWRYFPFDPNSSLEYFLPDGFSVPFNVTNVSSPTAVFTLSDFLSPSLPPGSQIDVQAQALFGNFHEEPYVHVVFVGGPTYDFTFKGTISDWSGTQTITIPEIPSASLSPSTTPVIAPSSIPSSSPIQQVTKEVYPIWLYAAFTALVFVIGVLVGAGVMQRRKIKKTNQ